MADYFSGTNSIPIGNGQEMNLYKAKNSSISVTRTAGTVLLKNFQDGDMVTGDKTNNKIDPMSDPQGSAAASVSYDSLGTMVVTVQAMSRTNNLLSQIYNNDEVVGIWAANDEERFGGDHAMIQKAPQAAYSKGVPMRAYTFNVFDYDYDGNHGK